MTRSSNTPPHTIDYICGVILEYLVSQSHRCDAAGLLAAGGLCRLRQLCAILAAGRADLRRKGELLGILSRTPLALPVPGGVVEFGFQFWRDFHTISVGGWEWPNIRALCAVVRPGDRIIDVGAHIGMFALCAARLAGPTGRVLAVEPEPSNAQALRANLARNGLGGMVDVYQVAVSHTTGYAALYSDGDTGGTEYSLRQQTGRRCLHDVRTTTLDAMVKRWGAAFVNCIKIDVEGAEDAVLRGAADTLASNDLVVFLELHPWLVSVDETYRVLGSYGFSISPSLDVTHRELRVSSPSCARTIIARKGDNRSII